MGVGHKEEKTSGKILRSSGKITASPVGVLSAPKTTSYLMYKGIFRFF
jgi:hypothetical protein